MIKIINVCKNYGDLQVYHNFNLEIEEGKITCILGESGSGKTTLLNMVAALTPYTGEITPVRCAYVFQQPRLVPNLTVKGNLKLVCDDEKKIDEMLSAVGLTAKSKSYPASLSGGQARRVALARAFLYDADIVLLDEPFSSLDLKIKIETAEFFKKLQREGGKTALFVTHDVDEAAYLSDRAVVLKDGQITLDIPNPEKSPYGAYTPVKQQLIQQLLK